MGREETTLRRILGKSWNTLSFVRRDALVAALAAAHAAGAREAEEKLLREARTVVYYANNVLTAQNKVGGIRAGS